MASVDDQLKVIVLPRAIRDGLAVRFTVGRAAVGGTLTVTVMLSLALPPAPLQVIV